MRRTRTTKSTSTPDAATAGRSQGGKPQLNGASAELRLIQKRLAELRPVLASAVVGDFSKDLKIPKQEDEFTELFVGVQSMQEVIREQLQELTALNEQLEAKAQERSRALEEAQALTNLGSWQFDITTGQIAWSDELYRIYGLKPQERPIGYEEFMSMIHQDDRQRVSDIIAHSLKSGKPFEFEHRIILPNGSHRMLHGLGKMQTDPQGRPLQMFGTSQDITERKSAELAMHQSDERFRAVTMATHDLVYDLDLRQGTMWFNESLQTEYGYKKGSYEPTLDWWLSRMHPSEVKQLEEQFEELLRSKRQTWSIEYRVLKADGKYALVRNRAYLLRDTNGEPERMIGSCLDITEARQLERAKDEFISLVSHQLRTPLTIIRLYGNMLNDGIAGPLGKGQLSYVRKMTAASIRLIKLVGDILNISRLELNRIRIDSAPSDANQLIGNCLEELAPLAESKGIKVSFTPAKDVNKVALDNTMFTEIVHNLVGNALNYGRGNDSKVQVSFVRQKQGYLLSVKDNGVGIPAEAQGHIFERFYRAHNAGTHDSEGSGLGLYMVKLFTEAAGGKVWFSSTEGKGTSFYVRFPPEGMRPKSGAINASASSTSSN